MTTIRDPERVRPALRELDFPASKERIVAHAEEHGATGEVLAALRALPLADYTNATEVVRSVPAEPVEGGQEDNLRAERRRRHTHHGLAEHAKDVARPPIEEELGENRGS